MSRSVTDVMKGIGRVLGRNYEKITLRFHQAFASVESEFDAKCAAKSDINEHLPMLRDLSKECGHVTEMGVRSIVSTWAFLEGQRIGNKGTLISIDINHPSYSGADLGHVERLARKEAITFRFIQGSTLAITIEPTDFLFIDTLHQYGQLKGELELHASKARKYIGFHDTETFGVAGEGGGEGLSRAIQEFLDTHKEWRIKKHYSHNNGATILERVSLT